MNLTLLYILTLSTHGFWFGGEPASIRVQPVVKGLPAAELQWELGLRDIRLEQGTIALSGDDTAALIHLTPPKVRVRVAMRWVYRVVARDTKKILETGEVAINVFPNDLIDGMAGRVGPQHLLVCEKTDAMGKVLEDAGVHFKRVAALSDLEFAPADSIILVGQDVLTDWAFEQLPLLNLADAGASVMLFGQSKPSALFGFPLVHRFMPGAIDWQMDHPLLTGFDREDLRSWDAGGSLSIYQLPMKGTVVAIGASSRESGSPADAVVLKKSVGRGQIVLCQLPLGDWKIDPRSQMFLRNSIDYLLSPSMPAPEQDKAVRPVKSLPEQTIHYSSEGMP